MLDKNISRDIVNKISAYAGMENIEKYIPVIEKNKDIGITTYFDYDYPRLLAEIESPPLVLYYKGNIDILSKRCISIVGTRHATEKGKYHARSFAREMASEGWTVVSGMAMGIDSSAHRGALSMGDTCAVLGCGVDVVYPRENKELYNKICENGVIISEFMPGQRPERWHFPVRNRIMSGISQAVLLIEAPEKSGAINTVNHALEQGRDVYVLNESVNEPEFSGNRMLINEGAIPVTNPYDIINNLGYTAYDSEEKRHFKAAEDFLNIKSETEYENDVVKEKNNENIKDYSQLEESELNIFNIIKSGTEQFDEIVLKSNMMAADVGYALTMLEFKGFIAQYAGKVYREI